MKTILSCAAMLFACVFCVADLGAAEHRVNNIRELDKNGNGIYEEGEVDPCASYQTGPCVCYCPVTRFAKQDYCETRCVKEPYTVCKKCCRYVDQTYTKKCCRQVPQYYEKRYCRQVPQYYTKTCCRMVRVPQYYEKTCCRKVPEYYTKTHCRMVPEYYEKSYCRKVPQYYTVNETRYRNKYVKDWKCCYKPYTCMEQKCIDAPMNCLVNASKQNGNGQFARSNGNYDNNAIAMETDSNAMTNDRASMIKDQIEEQNMIGDQEYVDVSFDNGTVRLMGLVHSKRKRDQIGAFVQSLDGVRQVDNQITIDTSFLKR